MEPVLIATKADHTDLCAVVDFTLDMVIGHDRQDFTASFDPIDGVGGGSLLYIDGTEYGGVVDDVTTDTETGITSYHGRTWDGVLAAKRIMPPSGSAYRTVSGEANGVLASLITLLDLGSVFAASTAVSGITISSYQFDRFVDAYEGIYKMLKSAGAKLVMHRENGVTVMEAKAAATISDEADSDLLDFMLTKTSRTVNHLVCAGEGELQDRVVIDLYADASGNVSQVQSLFGIDEITDFYDYNNADAVELLAEGTKKLKEYQTKGAVEITHIGSGEWDVGDTLVARDNRSGTTVSAPIVGKTVKLDSSTNWELSTSYEVGEVSRTAATVSGTAEQPEKVDRAGDTMTGDLHIEQSSGDVYVQAKRTDTNTSVSLMAGSSGINHGVWSDVLNSWIVYADGSRVHYNGLGDDVTKDISSSVTVASNTNKSIGSVTLQPGSWVVVYGAQFPSNSAGSRAAWLYSSADSGNDSWYRATNVQLPPSGAQTYLRGAWALSVSSSTTLYLTLWHTAGTSLSCYGYIRAIRVG